MEIPVVDVSRLGLANVNPGKDDYSEVGGQLYDAFTRCGFVYLVNHGVPEQSVDDLFVSSSEFFTLSPDQKRTFIQTDPNKCHGYVAPGQELLDNLKEEPGEKATSEVRESYDVKSLVPGDERYRFPDSLVPGLRPAFGGLVEATMDLGYRVLRALAIKLKLESEFFVSRHSKFGDEESMTMIRALYYPQIHEKVKPGTIRCGEHSDFGTITFLYQDSLGGLEVRGVNRQWIQAKPIEGSILVNIGDLMETYTNGLFPATRHRVVVPVEEVRRRKARQSLAVFLHPDRSEVARPIHGEEPNSSKYCLGINAAEYKFRQFAAIFGEGKTY